MRVDIMCPLCGHVVKMRYKAICKYCNILILLDEKETTIGVAQKVIITCKK